MKPSTKDGIKGTLHQVKGKVKEKAGQIVNDPDLEAKGKAERNTGKVEKKVAQIEKVLGEGIRRALPEACCVPGRLIYSRSR